MADRLESGDFDPERSAELKRRRDASRAIFGFGGSKETPAQREARARCGFGGADESEYQREMRWLYGLGGPNVTEAQLEARARCGYGGADVTEAQLASMWGGANMSEAQVKGCRDGGKASAKDHAVGGLWLVMGPVGRCKFTRSVSAWFQLLN